MHTHCMNTLIYAFNVKDGETWHNGEHHLTCRQLLSFTSPSHMLFKKDVWLSAIDNDLKTLLDHPNYDPPTQQFYTYEKPMMDVSTAAYDDVDPFLNFMYTLMCSIQSFLIILVVGDGQSYTRMVWLKKFRPHHFKWMVPLPGEFHFVVHVLQAVHILWYNTFIRFFTRADVCNNEKTIKNETWVNVTEWHHYDFFYQYLILACM